MGITCRVGAHLLVLALAPLALVACDTDDNYHTTTSAERNTTLESRASTANADFKAVDAAAMQRFFDQSAGYVVFPEVAKGGFVIGASRGDGVLYEHGMATHYVTMTAGTIGAQIGGQVFKEIIFFQSQSDLEHFKSGQFEFDANASAVVVKAGATAAADYHHGVAVFITGERGAMVEASIGGQKFAVRKIM